MSEASESSESTAIVVVKRPRGGLFAAVRGVPVLLRALARGDSASAETKGVVEPAPGPANGRPAPDEPAAAATGSSAIAPTGATEESVAVERASEPPGLRAGLVERGAVVVAGAAPELVVEVPVASVGALLRWLREAPDRAFDVLHDLTVVDRLPESPRFELVYFLRSTAASTALRVRVRIESDPPELDSVAALWRSADWLEREAKDLFGVRFVGHPGLQPLLLPPDFEGAPLRRDFAEAVAGVGAGEGAAS